MAVFCGPPFIVRNGTKEQLIAREVLFPGELGWTIDENLVYIGGPDGSPSLVGRADYDTHNPTGSGIAGQFFVNTTSYELFFSQGDGWVSVFDSFLGGYVTQGELTTTSGNIVAWVAGSFATQEQLTTVSGDIVSQIPSLTGYATELWATDLVNTTSGSIIDYVNTVSGVLSHHYHGNPLLIDVGPNLEYGTIQAAIDACDTSQGDYYLVRVFPGVYNEDIILKDSVDMVGLNYSACILNGSVSWPASTCTPDGWSCILDMYINGYTTTSGFALINIEEGQHDLNNMWCVLTASGVPASIVKMSGGWLHGYLPEYQYYQLGETEPGVLHPVFWLTGGKYEEQSAEMYIEAETSAGRIVAYDIDSNVEGDGLRMLNPKISMNFTADYFDGEADGICCSVQGPGVVVEAGFIKMTARAGGEGFAYHLDAGETGSTDNRVVSNANRIEVTGFSFNYYAETHNVADMLVSHFDTITAQDGFSGDIATAAFVHSDEYGELHLNRYIRFSPTTLSGNAVDRMLLQVDIGGSTSPSLSYYKDYLGDPRLMWDNPDGSSSLMARSYNGVAVIGSLATGPNAHNQIARLGLGQDTGNPTDGQRKYRWELNSDPGDLTLKRFWSTQSGEGWVPLMTVNKEGLTSLRYGDPVDRFLNESSMASYSPYALPTQKSVVDYVDTVSGTLYDRFAGEYATQEDLTTTSGDIMDYIQTQGAATVPYVDTASGTLHQEIITTSGVINQTMVNMAAVNRAYVDAYIKPYRYLSVSVSGGDFNRIQDAIDSITITDFTNEYWAIQVHPGIYYEDVYLKDNVDLIGDSYDACMIDGSINWVAASGCSAGLWSAIQNLTVQSYTTTSGFCAIYAEAGEHDIINSYVYVESDSVGANCVELDGGNISSYLTMYEYYAVGDSSGHTHRGVRAVSGCWESMSDVFLMTVEDTTDSSVCLATQRSADPEDYFRFNGSSIDLFITGSGYSGRTMVLRSRGTTHRNSLHGCRARITGNGGTGHCYVFYINSSELGFSDGNNVRSSSNRFIVEGFEINHLAYIGSLDILTSHFDDVVADDDGVVGNTANYFMVSSEAPGELRVTHELKIGSGLDQNQNILIVDTGAGGEASNPRYYYDRDYFGYGTATWLVASGGVANLAESSDGPVLMGSMSRGPNAFASEQRLSVWAHDTDSPEPLGYERRGYRLKRNTDETFSISRHWTYEDGGAFVDLLNIDPWGGLRLRNSNVRVSAILDEDDFASNSASGIATQQSTRAFMENTLNTVSGILIDILSVNGFLHVDTVALSFDNGTRTLTLSPEVGHTTYSFISQHSQFERTGDTKQISDVEGAHFVYYYGNTLYDSTAVWNMSLHTPVAYIYWDRTNQQASILAYEGHSTDMANATHSYLHSTIGTVWGNGLSLIHNATTSGSPNIDNRNTWLGLTNGSVWDEDIRATITNVSGTSTAQWAQDLGDVVAGGTPNRSSKLPSFYTVTSGSILWRKSTATDFPFIFDGSNVPLINNLNGSTWELSQATEGYFIYWLYGTTDINDPIMTIPHTEVYASLVDAQAVASTAVFTGRSTALASEMKLLYKLVYQYDAGYDPACKYSILRDVTDYRSADTTPVVGASTQYHAALADLNVSGHPAGVISLDINFTGFLNGYLDVQAGLERIDSYVPVTFATKSELSTTSGIIVGYIDAQDFAQNALVDSKLATTSGTLRAYTDTTVTTTSGDLKDYIDSVAGAQVHGLLNGLDADDHPQYTASAHNETVSGNWIINTKLGFNNYNNSSPTDGERWRQSDQDFRTRQNSNTLVDAMNSMCQVRQSAGISPQDCNTSAGVAIQWNAQDVVDGLYGHSVSVNNSRITVSGTAWYKVGYSVTHVNQTNQRKDIVTQLRKNGTTYLTPGKVSAISINTTDNMASNTSPPAMYRLTSGDYIEVMASGIGSVGSANTDQAGGCWLTVEFVRWSN